MQPGSACVKRRAGACTRAAPLASVGPDTGGAGSSAPVEDGPARPRTIRPAPVSNVPRPVEDGQPGLSNMGSPGPARPRGWPAHRRPYPPRQRQGWPVRPSYPPRGLGQCRAVSGPVASLEDGPGPGPVEHERHPDRASLERACGPGPAPRKRPARMAARTRTSADAARPSSASPRNRPILGGLYRKVTTAVPGHSRPEFRPARRPRLRASMRRKALFHKVNSGRLVHGPGPWRRRRGRMASTMTGGCDLSI